MFNLMYTMTIYPFLFVILLLVSSTKTSGAITGCIGMKDSYIKICILMIPPETGLSCPYIKSCIISVD